jgi:hypothetical protein
LAVGHKPLDLDWNLGVADKLLGKLDYIQGALGPLASVTSEGRLLLFGWQDLSFSSMH